MSNKEFNDKQWTRARFYSFVKGALRSASQKWPPKHRVKQKARIDRGLYRCAGYKRHAHDVPVTLPGKNHNSKRIDNVFVDHITPVVDPTKGFTTWDDLIYRLFVDESGLQILCRKCHGAKTDDERRRAKKTADERKRKKND